MPLKRIVVVGGGPAGMMAAIRAGQLEQQVILVEKNPTLGEKLLLSGKGRCNLTNSCDLDSFLRRFSKDGEFLRDAFKKFFNQDLMNFFQDRGLALKVERQQRVFPVTEKSDSVVSVLKKELAKNKVKVFYSAVMKDIFMQNGQVKGMMISGGKTIPADKIILATGGISYSFTGSSGEGLEFARRLGHKITSLRPGLVPLQTRQIYPKLKGLSLKNIRIEFSGGQSKISSDVGELIFTHFGISGALVLSLSKKIIDWLAEGRTVYAGIDLKPGLSLQQLDARLLREFKENARKAPKSILKNLMPQRLADCFIEILKIRPDKKANQITADERRQIVSLLKNFKLNIVRARPIEEAMVTRGGVSLKDINPRTMESRRIKGLYFAGEMIDVDADTGGFNLQAAFSTGYLAGESAALN